jgi:ribulose-phosphate 3-epimerase
VKAYVSLWSADLLAVGEAVDLLAGHADGFDVDVFDGHDVPDLLFGPDFVAALRERTDALVDVHLAVGDPDRWAERFAEVGADLITVHPRACPDVRATLERIVRCGARPAVAVEVDEPVEDAFGLLDEVDRVLVMGTPLGVKGRELDAGTGSRVAALVAASGRTSRPPEVVVDGGIRRHAVPVLAAAGATGVVPGSLIFGDPDPRAAVAWIHGQPAARAG